MKLGKSIGTLIMIAFALLLSAPAVFAETVTEGPMVQAVAKKIAEEHDHYKKGSLKLHHVKTVEVGGEIGTLKMAVAEYLTVRDTIFYFTHKQIVYYSPSAEGGNGKVLTASDVGKIAAAKQYQKQYQHLEGTFKHLGAILSLCALILLIPGFFAFYWAKQQYSVLSYKLKHNLFHQTGRYSYK